MSLNLKTPDRHELRRLLRERNQHPKRVAELDAEIRRRFERKVSMLCLDMSGFSRLSSKHGIIHYLAMIEQMEGAARPAVERNNGVVLKQEADNLFAVFENPRDALESALDIFSAFDAMNSVLPEERDIHASIGIGYGDTLLVAGDDLFGNEMNLASKLGEDIAKRSEILFTQSAYEALPSGAFVFTSKPCDIGGLSFTAYHFDGRVEEDLT